MLHVNISTLNEINKALFNFLWNGKQDKIKRKTVIGNLDQGGLKMLDIYCVKDALLASWVKRICYGKGSWRCIPFKYLSAFGEDVNLLFKMNGIDEKLLEKLPIFYEQVISAWYKVRNQCTDPNLEYDIQNQMIWGNKYILSKGKPLLYPHWINSGFVYVKDIVQNGSFMNDKDVFQKLKVRRNWTCELLSVKYAIRKRLKEIEVTVNTEDTETDNVHDLCFLKTAKLYQFLMQQKFEIPGVQDKWEVELKCKPDWKNIWYNQTYYPIGKHLMQLNYKLLHRILPCGQLLHVWKIKPSNVCNLCNCIEDYKHLFISCSRLKSFWAIVKDFIYKTFRCNVVMDFKVIVLGYKTNLHNPPVAVKHTNLAITIAKYVIFRSWLEKDRFVDGFAIADMFTKEMSLYK